MSVLLTQLEMARRCLQTVYDASKSMGNEHHFDSAWQQWEAAINRLQELMPAWEHLSFEERYVFTDLQLLLNMTMPLIRQRMQAYQQAATLMDARYHALATQFDFN